MYGVGVLEIIIFIISLAAFMVLIKFIIRSENRLKINLEELSEKISEIIQQLKQNITVSQGQSIDSIVSASKETGIVNKISGSYFRETESSTTKLCPSCNVFQDYKETECPNCEYDLTNIDIYTQSTRSPSLKAVVLTTLVYLFGSFILTIVLGFMIGFIGYAIGTAEESLISFAQFLNAGASLLFSLIFSIFLVNSYCGYFFPVPWKTKLYNQLKTGLEWSIPYIVIIGILALDPNSRAEWLKYYLLTHGLSLENVTIPIVILISSDILVVSFLEELIFRGMIQQYIMKSMTPVTSILITAGIFTIAHFGYFFFIPVSFSDIVSWFVVGIFTGFAFNKYNSCISSFIPHIVFNLKFVIIVPLMLV